MRRDKVPIIASQRLVELLSRINHQISSELSEMIRWKNKSVITYYDFGENEDAISFIYSNKLNELASSYSENYKEKAWKEKRAEMRIGKVIKLIFTDRFPINMPKGDSYSGLPYDIESFVNMYKAERSKNYNYKNFSIVKGTTIVKWYNQSKHTRFAHEETTLGRSCMRYDESSKYLRMYALNGDKINMLMLKDDEGKIKARALVWHLDNIDRIFMDRVYFVNDFDVELFKDYARENGWLHKSRQTFGWSQPIVDTKNNITYNWNDLYMEVALNKTSFKKYPYIDTLSIYNTKTGILCNNGKLLDKKPYIHLMDYQGNFLVEYENEDTVFSNYHNRNIVKDEAIYCEIDDDWVYQGSEVYVHNSGGLYAVKNSSRIVSSTYLNKKKYFIESSCIWSDYMNTMIWKDSAVDAYLDKDKKYKILIHRKLIGKFFEKVGDDILKIEIKLNKNGKKPKYWDYKEQYANKLNSGGGRYHNFDMPASRPTLGHIVPGSGNVTFGYDIQPVSPIDDESVTVRWSAEQEITNVDTGVINQITTSIQETPIRETPNEVLHSYSPDGHQDDREVEEIVRMEENVEQNEEETSRENDGPSRPISRRLIRRRRP